MAAISIALSRGASGLRNVDFTVGTSAPGAGDLELRFNTTDTNAAVLTRKDVYLLIETIQYALKSGTIMIGNTPIL